MGSAPFYLGSVQPDTQPLAGFPGSSALQLVRAAVGAAALVCM